MIENSWFGSGVNAVDVTRPYICWGECGFDGTVEGTLDDGFFMSHCPSCGYDIEVAE